MAALILTACGFTQSGRQRHLGWDRAIGRQVIEWKSSLMFLTPVTTVERQEFAAAC